MWRQGASAAALAACAATAQAQVYVRAAADGSVHLSDRPAAGYALLVPGAPAGVQRMAREAALRHGVDPVLVRAVIGVESAWNPRAVSPKGAAGLMQLMPQTARRYGVADRFDPAQNVDAGVRYLRDLLGMFRGDLPLALAAYNAGEGAVLRHGGRVPPYPESRRYVERVLRLYGAGS